MSYKYILVIVITVLCVPTHIHAHSRIHMSHVFGRFDLVVHQAIVWSTSEKKIYTFSNTWNVIGDGGGADVAVVALTFWPMLFRAVTLNSKSVEFNFRSIIQFSWSEINSG